MTAIPSLTSAFQSLLKPISSGFNTPAVPQVSAPQIGPSSLSALGIKTPVAPNVAAINAANPHTGANASYVNPANATASKGTVPYIPAGVNGGGSSLVPTSTSATTKLPTSNVPGAISPQSSSNYIPPALPTISSTPTTTPTQSTVSSTTSAAGGPMPAQPSLASSDTSTLPQTSPGQNIGAVLPNSTGVGSYGSPYTASPSTYSGTSTAGLGSAGDTSADGLDPYHEYLKKMGLTDPTSGLGLFASPEQLAAQKAYQNSLSMSPEEEAAQRNLNNLNTSAATAYTNTAGQAIPLPFITGQQAQLQREQSTLAQPLESQIALLQAKRQLAGTASKTALDQANARIAAFQEFSKPVPISGFGGSLVKYNASTGQYEQVVNPFGTAGGTANGTDADTTKILGDLAQAGIDTTRYNIPGLLAAVRNGATPQDILAGRGAAAGIKAAATTSANAGPAADAASLKSQQAFLDTTNRAYSTATANYGTLIDLMTRFKLNQSNVPMINQLQNAVKAGIADPGAVATFQSSLQTLRNEYAMVLAKGNASGVTVENQKEANGLIPDNLSAAQMATIKSQLDKEGANAISESQKQINTIQARLKSGSGSTSNTNLGTSGGSSASDPLGIL